MTWWVCPEFKKFWVKLHVEIETWLKISLNFSPENCLLHLFTGWKKIGGGVIEHPTSGG